VITRTPALLAVLIPEGAGPCQGGFCGGSGWVRACVTGVCCFPVAAMFVVSGWPGQGPGGARPPAGAAAQASLRRPAGSPMMGWRETAAVCRAGYSVSVQVRPNVGVCRRAVPLAALIPSRAPAGPGRMGRVRVRGSGQAGVNQDRARAAGGRRGREPGDLAPGRWPGKAVHAARAGGAAGGEWSGSRVRQRIWPSRRP
jgi:hypothetical protein